VACHHMVSVLNVHVAYTAVQTSFFIVAMYSLLSQSTTNELHPFQGVSVFEVLSNCRRNPGYQVVWLLGDCKLLSASTTPNLNFFVNFSNIFLMLHRIAV